MNQLIASLVAALAVAFGLTALTTVSVRSERFRSLVTSSFVLSFVVLVALFLWADLPASVTVSIAGIGIMIGVLCMVLLKAARHFERKSGLG